MTAGTRNALDALHEALIESDGEWSVQCHLINALNGIVRDALFTELAEEVVQELWAVSDLSDAVLSNPTMPADQFDQLAKAVRQTVRDLVYSALVAESQSAYA